MLSDEVEPIRHFSLAKNVRVHTSYRGGVVMEACVGYNCQFVLLPNPVTEVQVFRIAVPSEPLVKGVFLENVPWINHRTTRQPLNVAGLGNDTDHRVEP